MSIISNQTWNYDDADNWNNTTKTVGTQTSTENRSYNAADGITSIAGNATTQDLKGNLTEFEINGKEYDVVNYDLENRINKVDVDGTDVEYRYDAMGRRVLRKEANTTTALIWWGDSECAEHKHTATQTVIQNDIFDHPSRLNAVCARAVDGSKNKIQWYHKNYLDHVYAVSDDRGDFLEHYRYTAFGEVTIYDESGNIQQETQIDNDILWNTRRLDEVSGFYLYKYRHYAPELGRWPSRDPIEEDGGIKLYAFVRNSPVNWWDRLGLRGSISCGSCITSGEGKVKQAHSHLNLLFTLTTQSIRLRKYKCVCSGVKNCRVCGQYMQPINYTKPCIKTVDTISINVTNVDNAVARVAQNSADGHWPSELGDALVRGSNQGGPSTSAQSMASTAESEYDQFVKDCKDACEN